MSTGQLVTCIDFDIYLCGICYILTTKLWYAQNSNNETIQTVKTFYCACGRPKPKGHIVHVPGILTGLDTSWSYAFYGTIHHLMHINAYSTH